MSTQKKAAARRAGAKGTQKPSATKRAPPAPRTPSAKVAAPGWFPTKASSPADYALLSMNTILTLTSTAYRDERSRRVYSAGGADFATLELEGDELVVEFQAPSNLDHAIEGPRTLRDFLSHYEPVRGRPGWLRFRRPATRDPRPDLDARVGPMLGQAARQRRP